MNDLKSHAEAYIKTIQAQINERHELIKLRNKKTFDEIAALEAQISPIQKLIKDFEKESKAATKK